MFERYTEKARRALFFARYETSQTGSLSIESEHLLLGVLREPGPIGRRILADAGVTVEQLRQEVEQRITFREKVGTSVEIPFGADTKRILQYTAEEADNLKHSHIGTEHMLLALLRVPEAIAGTVLIRHGLRLQATREAVAAMPAEGAAPTAASAATSTFLRAANARADTESIVADIERIQRLVQQISMTLRTPHEATELLHLLSVELSSLRSRFP
jgi:ATP-dependent Clp protease ATP-binding subunit ClpC